MSIRSVKLKLKTNSASDSLELRQGLWATHQMINEGIAYYMDWLTLLRQKAIKGREKEWTEESIKSELLTRIKEQQKRNNWTGASPDYNIILPVLRQLYELIVPSSVNKTGNSQSLSGTFLSPLVDPDSEGGKGTSKAGRKSRWQILKENADPKWEEEYKKYQAEKEADPTPEILQKLEDFGLRPLFPLFTDTKKDINWIPRSKRQFVRNWDRDMFQQAIERLLSWESWNLRVADERQKLEEGSSQYYKKYLSQEKELVQSLQQYEQERAKQLEHVTGYSSERYRIKIRSVRGWENIYPKWLKRSIDATDAELWEIVNGVQQNMSNSFGDPDLYKYLVSKENRHIWQGGKEKANLLKNYAVYNALQEKLQRSKEQATFTLPDPVNHPLWVRFEARGGTNLYKYTIEQDGNNLFVIFDRMLWPNNHCWEEKSKVVVQLAPSHQIARKRKNSEIKYLEILEGKKGKQQVIYRDYSSEIPMDGVLGGAKLQFDRKHLQNCKDKVATGEIGPVYLNISIDVTPLQKLRNGRLQTPLGKALTVVSAEWPKVVNFKAEQLIEWMNQTDISSTKGVNSLQDGMRVMSIDLGQRTSASISIFEVVKKLSPKDEKKLFFEIPNTKLFAVHRRSLLLNLPGESPNKIIKEKRIARDELYLAMRFQVRLLARILQLHTKETKEERLAEIQNILNIISEYSLWSSELKQTWKLEISTLRKEVSQSKEGWKEVLISLHRRLESSVGVDVSKWRKALSKDRRGLMGLSMKNLEELERTRRLLISWSKRSRTPGQSNRIGFDEKFGQRQLTHMQNFKEDRLKQLANLIVMTALGYKYDDNRKKWLECYPACQVILFEDLSRYRFKLDRPRRENSQLMKWAHRSIPKTVSMQGEIFGLQVGDIYAAFSSRFHAKTGAPGIRCRELREEDLSDKFLKDSLIREQFITEEQWDLLRPGDIVPWKGGELFVTLDINDSRKLIRTHADINAAQNLQRRFWMQRNELFRISCQRSELNGDAICVPSYQSERWKKQMGKGYFMRDTSSVEVYKWEKVSRMKINTTPSEEFLDIEDIQDIQDMEEIKQANEEASEARGDHVTLFRDPSGLFFASDAWIPQVLFWSIVKNRISSVIRQCNLKR